MRHALGNRGIRKQQQQQQLTLSLPLRMAKKQCSQRRFRAVLTLYPRAGVSWGWTNALMALVLLMDELGVCQVAGPAGTAQHTTGVMIVRTGCTIQVPIHRTTLLTACVASGDSITGACECVCVCVCVYARACVWHWPNSTTARFGFSVNVKSHLDK
jgi:hypothetical protein